MQPEETNLPDAWIRAAASPPIAAALEGVYARVADAIAARGPACWASGRCCNFEETGHLLYVTGLEAAYTITRLPRRASAPQEPDLAGVTLPQFGTSVRHPICPFQVSNLCSVHTIKPLGCRVYFCDRSAQEWQQELSERSLHEIRALHDEHEIPYRYGEWRSMLAMFA